MKITIKKAGSWTVSIFKSGQGTSYEVYTEKQEAYNRRNNLREKGYQSHVHEN